MFTNFSSKKITVIGLGVSNIPLIEYLFAHGAEKITARDRKNIFENAPSEQMLALKSDPRIEFVFGADYLADMPETAGAGDLIFKSPGIRRDLPELSATVAKGAFITSEIALFISLCISRRGCRDIVAITGSEGKTTTTTLTGELLRLSLGDCPGCVRKVYVGGNIGKPLIGELDRINADDIVVLELSSFQLFDLAETGFAPKSAVVVNVTPNHLDWHTGMEEYIESKKIVFGRQSKENRTILNYDNTITRNYASQTAGEVHFFSMEKLPPHIQNGIYLDGERIYLRSGNPAGDVPLMDKCEIKLRGRHHIANCMAAFCAASGILEIKPRHIIKIANTFGGVEHRNEFVRTVGGVEYYNSSIDSSPTRTIAALDIFEPDMDKRIIIILGGYDKKLPFEPLIDAVKVKIKVAVLYGDVREKIEKVLLDNKADEVTRILKADSFAHACELARSSASSGDAVILAPACASFGEFKNFEERGNVFKAFVNGL